MGNCLGAEGGPAVEVCHGINTPNDVNLSNIFIMVPHMLEAYMRTPCSHGADIRSLRLVSRDMASTALKAVQWCVVQLGEGASQDLQQITRLMKGAVLRDMDLIVIVRAGERRREMPNINVLYNRLNCNAPEAHV